MNRLLILSDYLVSRSDEDPRSFVNGFAPPAPPSCAQTATDRTAAAGIACRDLQTLRAAKLPLRGWTGTRPEALPVHQPAWGAAPPRLRAQRHPRAGCTVHRQFPQAARHARRDLRDQRRAFAATRGSGVDHSGPGPRLPRLRQGGRHPRRHGCVLSGCRRSAVTFGGAR